MRKYIVFGTTALGQRVMDLLGENGICFCDNRSNRTWISGKRVIRPERLKDIVNDETAVIIASTNARTINEISIQLATIDKGICVFPLEDYAGLLVCEDAILYSELNNRQSFEREEKYDYCFPMDRFMTAGTITSYFWQDYWAAKRIYSAPVATHFDIGSRIDGFVSHLMCFGQKVQLIDIRPLDVNLPGVGFQKGDATNLVEIEDASIESISALCSLEHFGLGRYGDPIDPEACFKCFDAIQRKLKKNGRLYISVPVGIEHVEFNAHRVFKAETIVKEFDRLNLLEFSSCYKEEYTENVPIDQYDTWDEKGGNRFGLFLFQKP